MVYVSTHILWGKNHNGTSAVLKIGRHMAAGEDIGREKRTSGEDILMFCFLKS